MEIFKELPLVEYIFIIHRIKICLLRRCK